MLETLTPLHVLVVEDDADARENLRDILELDDYRVETAGSVREALGRGEWAHYSAVVLDRRLPDGTADDLLPRLRRLAPQAAVIVVTGYDDVQGAISALRLGAADYILKPINPDELRTRMGNLAERVRAEQRVRALANLPDENPAPVVRVRRDGTLLYANAASAPLLALWGCRVGEALPEPWRQRVREVLDARADREIEVSWDDRVCDLLLAPIAGTDYVNVYGRDVTDRKRAQEALRRERDFAESLIETAPAVVLVLDTAGRIVRFNHYMRELSGYALEEACGKDWFATFLPEPERGQARARFPRMLAGTDTGGATHPILTKDGRRREIRWSNTVLRGGEGEIIGVLAIGHDVTELREAQERAVQAERLAAVGRLVTVLAHESGNALANTQACLEMLRWEVEDRPEALDLISRVEKAQGQLRQLYQDVRGYAAPIRLEREVWDVSGIWRRAWESLAALRRDRDASLCEDTGGTDLCCAADAFRLEQVFRNIFENALAACPDPVRIEIRCGEDMLGGAAALRVSVRDNGPGLSPEVRQRIFEPFFTT
ncbi:MAG TPA: PAS domain S-box protein, partial [Gemmataceae bacterium]